MEPGDGGVDSLANSVPGPLAKRGKLLVSDTFERKELAPWKEIIANFAVDNGELVQTPGRKDHGSVARLEVPMKDVIINFRFLMSDAKGFSACFNDRSFKGSHVGHICRVSFRGKSAVLSDGKEGVFNKKIRAMKKDPAQKELRNQMLKGRKKTVKFNFKTKQWYEATIEVVNDEMRLSIDGKAIGYLKSPGFAHPTKQNFSLTGNGEMNRYDDLKIWEAAAK